MRKTRLEEKRSAMASTANTKVPAIKPNCKALVSLPTSDAGQPIWICKSGMTALTANHKEVPANCAKTMMGKTYRGV
jgi:hypothetical protein